MAEQRKLNIPRYDTDGEEIREEGTAESPSAGQRLRGAASEANARFSRNRQQRRQRRQEAPQRQRAAADRADRRDQRQTKRDARQIYDAETGMVTKAADPIAQLKLDTQSAQRRYMKSLVDSGVVKPASSKPVQRKQLSDLHQAYASMMVLQCIQPLQRGIGAESIMSTVGMGSMMWMLSPNFRSQVGTYTSQVAEAIEQRLNRREARDRKTQAKGDKAREKLGKYTDRTGRGREDMGGLFALRYRKKLERVERMERGHRDVFTEHSAALTQVGLTEAAYSAMRYPGADVAAVKDSYESAMATLYEYVETDGLDRAEMEANMRVIVGQRIERDPEFASVFSELGHGKFSKSDAQLVQVPGTDRTVETWTGGYEDTASGDTVMRGTFTLREPMTQLQHEASASQVIFDELTHSETLGEFDSIMEQYMVGSATRSYPDAVELVDDPVSRGRLNRARSMFASMEQDGFSQQDQKLIYMGAYINALENVEELAPQAAQMWAQRHGENWRERFADALDRYSELGEEAVNQPESQQDEDVSQPEAATESEATAQPESDVSFIAGRGGVRDERSGDQADFDPNIVDAEIVADEEEMEAQAASEAASEAHIVDAEVVEEPAAIEVEDLSPATLQRMGLTDEHGVIDEQALRELEETGVSLERAASMQPWVTEVGYGDSEARRSELIEEMSDHMGADILQSAQRDNGAEPDGNSWVTRHAYRSRQRALGALDPTRVSEEAARHRGHQGLTGDTGENYAEEIDRRNTEVFQRMAAAGEVPLSVQASHTPWDGDLGSNTRAREMLQMAQEMSLRKNTPQMQDQMHAVAYVRGLEKAVATDPSYEKVVRAMVQREGGNPAAWRNHEYQGAMGRTATGSSSSTYEQMTHDLHLTPVDAMDVAAPDSARSQAREQLSDALKGDDDKDFSTQIDLRKTSSKMRRHRQNLAYNGHEVVSGRYAVEPQQDQPQNSGPEPELG